MLFSAPRSVFLCLYPDWTIPDLMLRIPLPCLICFPFANCSTWKMQRKRWQDLLISFLACFVSFYFISFFWFWWSLMASCLAALGSCLLQTMLFDAHFQWKLCTFLLRAHEGIHIDFDFFLSLFLFSLYVTHFRPISCSCSQELFDGFLLVPWII